MGRLEITMLRIHSHTHHTVTPFHHTQPLLRNGDRCVERHTHTIALLRTLNLYGTMLIACMARNSNFLFVFFFSNEIEEKLIVIAADMSPAISNASVNQLQPASHLFEVHVKQQPMVKILKRPTALAQPVAQTRPKMPMKTLEQREQEYAQARLRILGSNSMTISASNAISPAINGSTSAINGSNKIQMRR